MNCDSVISSSRDGGEPVDLPCRFQEHGDTDHNHQGPRFSTWWNDDEPTARRTNQGAHRG